MTQGWTPEKKIENFMWFDLVKHVGIGRSNKNIILGCSGVMYGSRSQNEKGWNIWYIYIKGKGKCSPQWFIASTFIWTKH